LIVVDSSAIVAILFREPMAEPLLSRLEADQNSITSVANYVEAGQFSLSGIRPHLNAA